MTNSLLDRLRYHITGAIERGEGEAIVGMPVERADDCPVCKGHNVEGGSIDVEGDEAVQSCYCLDCGSQWITLFKFAGCSYIRTPERHSV